MKIRSLLLGVVGAFAIYGIVVAQSSTGGGGFSTKAIQALENCFDSSQNFICGPTAGEVTTLGGTTNTIAKFTGSETIGDSRITDDGSFVGITSDEIRIISSIGYIHFSQDSELFIAENTDYDAFITLDGDATGVSGRTGRIIHETTANQLFNASPAEASAPIADPSYSFSIGGMPSGFNNMPIGFFSIGAGSVQPMDGSDTINNVSIGGFSSAAHTGSGNETRVVNIRASSNHVNPTDVAINIEGGYDIAMKIADGSASDDALVFGDDEDFPIFFSGVNDRATFGNSGTDVLFELAGGNTRFFGVNFNTVRQLNIKDLPAAGASGDLFDVGVGRSVNAMDGSDTVNIMRGTFVNNDHTGSGNVLNFLKVDSIVGDAEATETAINIESGWDHGLSILADGSATDDNITLGASQTDDAQIYFNGSALVFDVDGANNSVLVDLADSSQGSWMARGSTSNFLNFVPANSTGFGFDFLEIQLTTINELSSDQVNMLALDLNDAEFEDAAGSTLNAIKIQPITADADVIQSGLYVGLGWDSIFTASAGGAWSATNNPDANDVVFFIDEVTDRANGPLADCTLVARLSDGTEIPIVELVSEGGCP